MPHELEPVREHRPEFLPPEAEYARTLDLATRLAGTEFVPAGSMRGNPPAVLAAMLTGREAGLGPMESLRSIHMIEGKPTFSAEAMMKLAMEAGHLIIVTETTRERATVVYRNAEWPDDYGPQEITFDLEDAELAGLAKRSMWSKYPRAMLRSRAITEAVRAGGLLSASGAAYTAEEITDEGDVEDAIIVEHIGPDQEDEDELAERRSLYERAATAYRRIKRHDEDLAGNAWTQATNGLGSEAWTEGDLTILRIRVADLERIAAEFPDEDDQGGTEPPQDDDGDDGGTDGADEPRASEEATESDEEIVDAEIVEEEHAPRDVEAEIGETQAEADAEEEHDPEECRIPAAHADETEEEDVAGIVADLEEFYGRLTVADVSALLRHGEVSIDLDADHGITLRLPRTQAGGILAALELIEALEAAREDGPRKTVAAALETAGWTPKGKRTLADARGDATPKRDTVQETSDEDDGAVTPQEPPAAEEATESDPAEGGLAWRRRYLARWKRAHRALDEISAPRARRAEVERLNSGLGEDDAWLGAETETIARIVTNAERMLTVAQRDAANPAIGDAR